MGRTPASLRTLHEAKRPGSPPCVRRPGRMAWTSWRFLPPCLMGGLAGWAATNTMLVPVELHDIRGPLDIRSPGAWLRIAALLAMLTALLAAFWWWWRQRPKAPSAPGPGPAELALRDLAAALDLRHDPERFATRVSEIARTYLEARFGLKAPERTTEEFLAELTTSAALESPHKTLLGEFLTRCDLVKFARLEPGPAELEELHAAAVRLVEETAPRIPAAPRTPEPAGGAR
ncbi:MAG: DUF4381 family protein [Verrucomicrobiae bacterium]|nr:DUF4381 family protein [Verrucomicrobiae bacterium]